MIQEGRIIIGYGPSINSPQKSLADWKPIKVLNQWCGVWIYALVDLGIGNKNQAAGNRLFLKLLYNNNMLNDEQYPVAYWEIFILVYS